MALTVLSPRTETPSEESTVVSAPPSPTESLASTDTASTVSTTASTSSRKSMKSSCVKRAKNGGVKYKKAPGAPRRFKSAYMFYSTDKHRAIREELQSQGINEKTTVIAKMVSEAWKKLPAEEKERFEELARKDKARFEVEKTMYTGPWKVPAKKRSQKDPSAPKRPMSAFLSFSHAKRQEVKAEHPNMTNAEISRVLAAMWKDAPQEEKQEHIDREFELRQDYKTRIAEWREQHALEMKKQREEREDLAMQRVDARTQAGLPMDPEDDPATVPTPSPPSTVTTTASSTGHPPAHSGHHYSHHHFPQSSHYGYEHSRYEPSRYYHHSSTEVPSDSAYPSNSGYAPQPAHYHHQHSSSGSGGYGYGSGYGGSSQHDPYGSQYGSGGYGYGSGNSSSHTHSPHHYYDVNEQRDDHGYGSYHYPPHQHHPPHQHQSNSGYYGGRYESGYGGAHGSAPPSHYGSTAPAPAGYSIQASSSYDSSAYGYQHHHHHGPHSGHQPTTSPHSQHAPPQSGYYPPASTTSPGAAGTMEGHPEETGATPSRVSDTSGRSPKTQDDGSSNSVVQA